MLSPLSWHGAVRAQVVDGDVERYRGLIERALDEFNGGRFEEARALFLQAHELRPSARTLRGLGQTEFELRHYVEALRLLEQARIDTRHALTDAQRREVSALIERCQSYVGRYRVSLTPSAASLRVDGEVPPARDELTLDVGEHVIEVSAPGHVAQARKLDVKGGEQLSLTVQLGPEAPEPSTPVAPPELPPTAAQPLDADTLQPSQVIGWASLGIAVSSLAGAIVAWRVGEAAAARWNDDARCLRGGLTREQSCGEYASRARTARTWSTIGLAVAAVGAVTSSVLLLPPIAATTESAGVGCADGPGDLGITCRVRF